MAAKAGGARVLVAKGATAVGLVRVDDPQTCLLHCRRRRLTPPPEPLQASWAATMATHGSSSP